MNKVYFGFSIDEFFAKENLPKSNFLYLHDDIPDLPYAQVFDPIEDHFNPLQGIDYKTARDLAVVLYTLNPQADSTLRVRNGRRALLQAFLQTSSLDKVKADKHIFGKETVEEVDGMIADLFASPVLKRVLCSPGRQFSFNPKSVILARIDPAELGEFDALALGLLLLLKFKGQVVVRDMDFYGRDVHVRLIQEKRLIAGVQSLADLPPPLRRALLSVYMQEADKLSCVRSVLYDDAVELAKAAHKTVGTVGFSDFISGAIGS